MRSLLGDTLAPGRARVQPVSDVRRGVANELADLPIPRPFPFAAPVTQRGHGDANPPRYITLIEQGFNLSVPRLAALKVSSNRFHAPIIGQRMCRRSMEAM